MDSECSRHMTGKTTFFIKLDEYDGGLVTFGDDAKGKIVAVGKVGKIFSSCINDVLLVHGLKHNLLSVSQLCDLGFEVIFRKFVCLVVCEKTGDILFKAKRCNNVYGLTLEDLKEQNVTCFTSLKFEKWLWHRKLGHASMYQISKLVKKNLVRGIPNIKFDKDITCDACQLGK